MRAILATLVLLGSSFVGAASADDDWRFRRTTPRADLAAGAALVLGVPAGRAWGIESRLRPAGPAQVALEVAVRDPAVREVFVRVAWYGRDTGRPRQLTIADSHLARAGDDRVLRVALDPPDGAIAYRMRVLARLRDGVERSAADAIRVTIPADTQARPGYTRLEEARP